MSYCDLVRDAQSMGSPPAQNTGVEPSVCGWIWCGGGARSLLFPSSANVTKRTMRFPTCIPTSLKVLHTGTIQLSIQRNSRGLVIECCDGSRPLQTLSFHSRPGLPGRDYLLLRPTTEGHRPTMEGLKGLGP